MFYPAYIHSDFDGSASAFFPDVPVCAARRVLPE
jgi:predicted RNase H-like HicB family nuclease